MRRRLIVFAYLAAAAFFLAHILNAWLSQALTRPAPPALVGAATVSSAPPWEGTDELVEEILSSGVFPLPTSARIGATDGLEDHPPAAQPGVLDLEDKVRLLGTVLGDGWSAMTVLEDRRTRQQALFRLHEVIPGVGEIVEIRKDGIVVEQDGVRERLELSGRMPAPAKKKEPVARFQFGPASRGETTGQASPKQVASLSPVHKVVDRRMIEESTSDLPKLLSQARAVPYYVNGQIDGWRVVSIESGSIFRQLGLQKGDVLQRVNGVQVKDPGTMLTLFQQVKNEDRVSLDLLRHNQRLAMTYEIR